MCELCSGRLKNLLGMPGGFRSGSALRVGAVQVRIADVEVAIRGSLFDPAHAEHTERAARSAWAASADLPRWTVENRQFMDRAKPAISAAAETSEFYFVPSSVRKSVCTLVRQLRGPHLSTCA